MFPKLGVGSVFFRIFRTPVSQKLLEISKSALEVNFCKFKDLQIWFHTFFSISETFLWDISKKLFFKKLCQMLRFPKRAWLGSNYVVFLFFVFFSFFAGNLVSSGQHSRGNVSAKLGVGGRCFLDISNPCISKTVGHIETNMEVLGRVRPHFFVFTVLVCLCRMCLRWFLPWSRTRFLGDRYHYFFIGKRLRTKATYK